jgi:membrane-associated protein
MDIKILYALLLAAAILGDFVNYSIGRHAADWVLKKFSGRIIKPIHMQKAHAYFEKYGAWAIILARFAPFLRTFVPFVAGGAKMSYSRFALFNAIGGFLWITSFLFAGYFFGQLPFVKDNFKLLIMGIIIVSLLPAAIGFLKARKDTENGTL